MPKTYAVRPLTDEEYSKLNELTHSRTAPLRDVERARIIWLRTQGERPGAVARQLSG